MTARLPSTMVDINKSYILKSKNTRKSLPHTKSIEFNDHVLVNLKDFISHMFAYGISPMNDICPYDNHEYMGTYVASEQNQNVTLIRFYSNTPNWKCETIDFDRYCSVRCF